MNIEDLKTDKQLEKIYYSNDQDSYEHLQEQMRSFLNELDERRKDDSEEEGLQAEMIIMPNAFASKITENEGKDPHEITIINLFRYIKEEKDYYLREAGQWFNLLKNERKEIYKNGIVNRVIDSEDKLMMAIESASNIQTKFQLTVLKALTEELWRIKQNGLYESVEVGFYSPLSKVDVEELNDELYSKLNEALKEEDHRLEIDYLNNLEEYDKLKKVYFDMHIHTKISDGEDSPLMLLLRAHRMGLNTISITDHNKLGGYEELKNQIEKILTHLEETEAREDLTKEEKEKNIRGAKRLLKVIEEMNIVTGCEVITTFKGCPYVEILAYGVDIEKLEEKLEEANTGLPKSGDVLCEGLKRIAIEQGFESDLYYIENRDDYKKLFFHELKKHPENAFLYKDFDGKTEEEQAKKFAERLFENKESNYYVDLSDNNKKNRKNDMMAIVQKMKEEYPDLVFDEKIIKNAGLVMSLFYNEIKKHPEDIKRIQKIDSRMETLKKIIYLGLYNEKSPLFIDLESTKPKLEKVIEAIHEAGGKALVAHWGRYLLSNEEVFDWRTPQGRKNLETIIDMCDGAECAYPDNPMDLRRLIYNLCKEKGKIISIGGDDHGKKEVGEKNGIKRRISKEGEQYQLGSQTGREVAELEWIKDTVISGKDFLKQVEEEHHYRARLKRIIERNRNENQKNPTNDKELKFQSEQGE